ncbi:MAG: hypothetical protein QOI89_2279 [Solirubrobacteraceae bacterium]|nr:hypothetical protein [Solirubrobacteraceae bacterium]
MLVGTKVIFQDQVGAWLSNDDANHRIALLAFPNFVDDPDKETRTPSSATCGPTICPKVEPSRPLVQE